MPRTIETLAGADSTTGKIGTIPAAGTVYVACPVSDLTKRVKWIASANKAFTVQRYVAESNPLSCTLTLADATAVDDGDTCILNGLTFEADTAASHANRKYAVGASNAATAANLAALLNDATYGLPGFTAVVEAVDATDVITLVATTGTALQFGQGTSDANEIAFADTTLAKLMVDGAAVADAAATGNTGTLGAVTEHENDGFVPVLGITNNDGADAMTAVVKAVRFAA